jgi:tetratricopeptide (TPR) repeat protein
MAETANNPTQALQDFSAELTAAQNAGDDPQWDFNVWVATNDIGQLYLDQKNYAKAADTFTQALAEAQDLVRAHDDSVSEDRLAITNTSLGKVADAENQPKKAVQFFQAGLAAALKAADDPQYYDDLWDAYEDLANEQDGSAKDYAGARQTYLDELAVLAADLGKGPDETTAAALKVDQAEAYGNLAWSELLTEQYAQALKDAESSLQIDPTQDWMKVNLAHAYLFNNQLPTAEQYYFADPNSVITETGKTFGETVLEDFKQFRSMKMSAPGMDTVQQTIVKMMSAAATPAKPAAPVPPAKTATPAAPAK